ncbi:hypothetical protein FN846DRAFT_935707 [Sphaerosporella brunnea]|uniref:Pentatricopeptide repeat domain-containing protein n=1 Tax=Sphaerosporella brunnea TaxID=1250544 RepID=A0A5J5F4T5_9PEZI|nr:hypothetical protein FN846DRAFT_935707 [Sphaerosporella brunnea]
MRRVVQSFLHARQLLLSPTTTAAAFATTSTNTMPPTVMRRGWVCAECRRNLFRKTAVRGVHSMLPNPAAEEGNAEARTTEEQRKKAATGNGNGNGARGGEKMSLGSQPLAQFIEETLDLSPQLPDFNKRTPVTVARLLFESDVAKPSNNRFVDLPQHARNWELWRTLLIFRKRTFQDQGVKDVWKGMKMRGAFDLPTVGYDADVFWGIFVDAGLKDAEFLNEVVEYAKELSERTNREAQWAPLYDEIILHHLTNMSENTVPLHWTLFPEFGSQNWGKLFQKAWEKQLHPKCHHLARKIHATLPRPTMYRYVIRSLCQRNEHYEAWRWHKHFLKHGDIPRESSAANELVEHNAQTGRKGMLEHILRSFDRGGIPIVESTIRTALQSRRSPTEAADIIFSLGPDIPNEAKADRFWCTLFSLVPVKEAFAYAMDFGKGCVVGEATVEKAMKLLERDREETAMILERTGLSVKLPDYPPPILQPQATPMDPSNIQLQHLLREGQIRNALAYLAQLQQSSTPLSRQSVALLFSALLRPRAPGKRPMHVPHIFPYGKDIDATTLLLFSLQRSGTKIPFVLWKELFRRLGMTQRLEELESLAFKLIRVYRPNGIPEISRENPYRKLFTPTVQRAFVEWGFLHMSDQLWGVQVLREMKSQGVYVDTRSVFRAVRVRAARMEGIDAASAEQLVERVSKEFGERVGDPEVLIRDRIEGRMFGDAEEDLREEIKQERRAGQSPGEQDEEGW